jgi:hypothetical protein
VVVGLNPTVGFLCYYSSQLPASVAKSIKSTPSCPSKSPPENLFAIRNLHRGSSSQQFSLPIYKWRTLSNIICRGGNYIIEIGGSLFFAVNHQVGIVNGNEVIQGKC